MSSGKSNPDNFAAMEEYMRKRGASEEDIKRRRQKFSDMKDECRKMRKAGASEEDIDEYQLQFVTKFSADLIKEDPRQMCKCQECATQISPYSLLCAYMHMSSASPQESDQLRHAKRRKDNKERRKAEKEKSWRNEGAPEDYDIDKVLQELGVADSGQKAKKGTKAKKAGTKNGTNAHNVEVGKKRATSATLSPTARLSTDATSDNVTTLLSSVHIGKHGSEEQEEQPRPASAAPSPLESVAASLSGSGVAQLQVQEVKQHLEQDQQSNHEVTTCCVCLDLPPQVVLVPCGHMNICWPCASQWKRKPRQNGGGVCPNCRTPIDMVQKVVPLN